MQANKKPEIVTQAGLRQLEFSYAPDYLAKSVADELFLWLERCMGWQEETISMFARQVRVPRQVSWCGREGVNYRYSGKDHVALGWPEFLTELGSRVAEELAEPPNFVLLNRYRTGADYMGWHTDAEATMGTRLASLSLGATRRFLLQDSKVGRKSRLELTHGSLLVMDGRLRHSLPRTTRQVGVRINLTFRCLANQQ